MQGNDNPAFGEGRLGLILLKHGGQLEVKDEDKLVTNEEGVLIYHADNADTLTLVPWGNVGWVRTWHDEKARRAAKTRRELAMRQQLPSVES